jgi:hypothetical protein
VLVSGAGAERRISSGAALLASSPVCLPHTGRVTLGSGRLAGRARGEGSHVVGPERLTADAPVATVDLLDDHPGDASHVLSFDRDHRIGEALDDLSLLLGCEDSSISLTLISGIAFSCGWVISELDVDTQRAVSRVVAWCG